ncbi:MAG: preprotein translocase subunit SecE [Chloroflexi bacterium]|nr:preprotein translocase subunit SecE [Chloroflexota bacterium]
MARSSAAPARPAPSTRLIPRPDVSRRGAGIGQFLREVWSELQKVVFPTRRELIKLTGLVIAVSVGIGFLLGAIDYVFSQLMRLILG